MARSSLDLVFTFLKASATSAPDILCTSGRRRSIFVRELDIYDMNGCADGKHAPRQQHVCSCVNISSALAMPNTTRRSDSPFDSSNISYNSLWWLVVRKCAGYNTFTVLVPFVAA